MKTFQTIDNRPYVATVTAEATVTDKKSGLVLAKATEPGQITFLAIGETTLVSDDHAVVVPASFSLASAGSAAAGGVNDARVAELVEGAVSTKVESSLSTPAGTDNALFFWCQLDGARVPAGALSEVTMMCRSDARSEMTAEPRYLGVWEYDEIGSIVRLGASSNAVSQVPGSLSRWVFDGLRLSGRELRLALLTAPGGVWPGKASVFGARVTTGVTDGSFVSYTAGQSPYLPELTFKCTVFTPRFARCSSDNTFTGNNTHTGVEAFNAPAVCNAPLLLGGHDVKTIMRDIALWHCAQVVDSQIGPFLHFATVRHNCSTSSDIDAGAGKTAGMLSVGAFVLDEPGIAYKAVATRIVTHWPCKYSAFGYMVDMRPHHFFVRGYANALWHEHVLAAIGGNLDVSQMENNQLVMLYDGGDKLVVYTALGKTEFAIETMYRGYFICVHTSQYMYIFSGECHFIHPREDFTYVGRVEVTHYAGNFQDIGTGFWTEESCRGVDAGQVGLVPLPLGVEILDQYNLLPE